MLSLLRDDYVMRDLGLGSCTWKRGFTCAVMKKGGVVDMEMEGIIVIHDNL